MGNTESDDFKILDDGPMFRILDDEGDVDPMFKLLGDDEEPLFRVLEDEPEEEVVFRVLS